MSAWSSDYITNFWEVDNMGHGMRSANIVYKLKQQFARRAASMQSGTDNGPQFTSNTFQFS